MDRCLVVCLTRGQTKYSNVCANVQNSPNWRGYFSNAVAISDQYFHHRDTDANLIGQVEPMRMSGNPHVFGQLKTAAYCQWDAEPPSINPFI
jgi:hypothetical protein